MYHKIIICFMILSLAVGWSGLAEAKGACRVGDKVRILWKGKWFPGTVRKVRGRECLVNPDGYSSKWNQWAGPERIRFAGSKYEVGDVVYAYWKHKNSWWLAEIKKVRGDRYKIHYKGQSDLWDEWIDISQLRRYEDDP